MKLKENVSLFIALIAILICVALAVANFIFLPDQIAMQLGVSGQMQNWLPKPLAVLVPVALSAIGMGIVWKGEKKQSGVILAVVGPVLEIIMFLMNRGL